MHPAYTDKDRKEAEYDLLAKLLQNPDLIPAADMALTADSFRDSLCRVIFSGILLNFRGGRPTDVTDFNDLLVSSGSGKAILQAVQATDSADSARISRELLLLTR